MKDNPSPLSMSRFKLTNGDLKPFDEMTSEEKIAFTMASAMKQIIENLEISIGNERMFNRAKFNVMKIFHATFDDINVLKAGKNG